MTKRLLQRVDKRHLWKLGWNLGAKSIWSVFRHRRRLKRGEFFPPFFYVSVINSCNLRCQGCWVDVAAEPRKIEADAMHRLINEAKQMGVTFFGIVGGEPFLHPQLLEIMEQHPDCYFQVFTNGHFVTAEVAGRLRKMGNVSPLFSIEGNQVVSDVRRGKQDVWNRTMEGMQHCLDAQVATGVCTSLCQSNIDDLLSEQWLDRLIDMGVLYTWFYVYRPVGPDPQPELCLTTEQQQRARRFVVEMRVAKPIIIIDAYYTGSGQALCPSATGFAHHINPWGDIEPCPVIQFAKESIYDERSLREVFNESAFLRDYRDTIASATRGCVVLERPDLLKSLVEKHGARDTTARGSAMTELDALTPRASQFNPGGEIPERSWAYRLMKWWCFTDFGAYQKHFQPENWRDPRQQ